VPPAGRIAPIIRQFGAAPTMPAFTPGTADALPARAPATPEQPMPWSFGGASLFGTIRPKSKNCATLRAPLVTLPWKSGCAALVTPPTVVDWIPRSRIATTVDALPNVRSPGSPGATPGAFAARSVSHASGRSTTGTCHCSPYSQSLGWIARSATISAVLGSA
jgi:hypothetical protein